MKRAVLAIFCCAALVACAGAAAADPAFDRDMANRYLQAAQSGDDDAQFYLGALYSAGVGVPRSDEEAFRWLSRAADQGHAHAMLILAGLYAIGRGGPQDNVKAYKWAYIVGSASKVDEFRNGARQLMSVLEPKMLPEQINFARTDASRWHAVPAARPAQIPAAADFARATPSAQPAATAPPQPAPIAPPQSAPAVTSTQPPVAPSPQPPARVSSNPSPQAPKKSDVDNLLDQVPPNLRKRFGF